MLGRRRIAGALLTTVILAGLTDAAAAQNTKPYKVVVAPDSVPGGGQPAMTATFSVPAHSSQQLGAADLTSPFDIVSVSPPAGVTYTIQGRVVKLRNLAVQPGTSRAVGITVRVPCEGGFYDWSIVGKQANDFSGPPGNAMTYTQDSNLRTEVIGGCLLRFAPEPQNARINERITGTDYTPSAAPVAVQVVDSAGNVITSSAAPVTLDLGLRSGLGTLGGTRTVNAVNGVATFSNVSINAPGLYTLVATSPGLTQDTSDQFAIDTVAVFCPENESCPPANVGNANSSIGVTLPSSGPAGYLTLSLNGGAPLDCAGYAETSGDWAVADGPERVKTVTYRIDRRVMNASPNNGVSFLEMCYGAPYVFLTKTGVSTYDSAFGGHVGLLPDCPLPNGGPCVLQRIRNKAGDGIIVAQSPPGDPAYRP